MQNSISLLILCIGSYLITNKTVLSQKIINHEIKEHNTKKQSLNSPAVINTWNFVNATAKAWQVLKQSDDPVSAVIAGCSECEELRCDGTVGYGGSPDEHGKRRA
jgi:isoaspartyl peptidase/L-asparaginase-like protein (Ntn-hydrolase superfamily)